MTRSEEPSEWRFVAEEEGRIRGEVSFRRPSSDTSPLDVPEMVIVSDLSLPWEQNDLRVGEGLLRYSFSALKSLGAKRIRWDLESAAFFDDPVIPTPFLEERLKLIDRFAPTVIQEKCVFSLDAAHSLAVSSQTLSFQSLETVGELAFLDALKRVRDGTLDRLDAQSRERWGPEEDVRRFYDSLEDGMRYEPRLWKLAYEGEGGIVGLVMPLKLWGDLGTFGYIGVVPDHRGRRFVDELLSEGTVSLQSEGVTRIIADIDSRNTPMQNAFRRMGYTECGLSWQFLIDLPLPPGKDENLS